jgi:glutamate-1-semialdehyde 2,1-aminomutase
MMEELQNLSKKHGHNVRICGPGAYFGLTFTGGNISDMRYFTGRDSEKFQIFRNRLLHRDIHIMPPERGIWFLSTAHSEDDIEKTLSAVNWEMHPA